MTFVYKLDDRPHKTTLAAREIHSSLIKSGGGSWSYEQVVNATLWTQTNTLGFHSNLLNRILLPLYKRILLLQTQRAMLRAKRILESPQ